MISRETRYHVSITELLKLNLMSHVAVLFGRPRTILKVLFFSEHQQFFQKSLGINFLYDRVLAFLFIGGGRIIWDRGGIFRIIINRLPRRISPRHLNRMFWWKLCCNIWLSLSENNSRSITIQE